MEDLGDEVNSEGEWELWEFLISEGQVAGEEMEYKYKAFKRI